MRFVFSVRLALLAVALPSLVACSIEPHKFAVTAQAEPSPPDALFRSHDPNLNDLKAKAYCADGYDKLDETTLPTNDGSLAQWQVRCTEYRVSFLPF
jgi:hypothetical protein